MKNKIIKSLGIVLMSAFLLGGCGNNAQGLDTTTATESESTEKTDETDTEKLKEEQMQDDVESEFAEQVKPDFEAMHYDTFIKNEAGEDAIGYQAPFGWNYQQLDNGAEYRRSENLPDSIRINYIENATEKFDIYKNMPDSLLEIKQDSESTSKQEKKLLGECDSPYGKGYLTMSTFTNESSDGNGGTFTSTSYVFYAIIPYGKDVIVVCSNKSGGIGELETEDTARTDIEYTVKMLLEPDGEIASVPDGYECNIQNDAGDSILGFHLPSGFQEDASGMGSPLTRSLFSVGENIILGVYNGYVVGSDYVDLYENSKTGETIHSEVKDSPLMPETDSISDTTEEEQVNTVYGTIKLYHQIEDVSYNLDDGPVNTKVCRELGLFRWNGTLYYILWSDANDDSMEYQGKLKAYIAELF